MQNKSNFQNTLDWNYSSGYCSGFSPDSLSNNPDELFYYNRVRRYKFQFSYNTRNTQENLLLTIGHPTLSFLAPLCSATPNRTGEEATGRLKTGQNGDINRQDDSKPASSGSVTGRIALTFNRTTQACNRTCINPTGWDEKEQDHTR